MTNLLLIPVKEKSLVFKKGENKALLHNHIYLIIT